jgi:hypothetical protein
MKKLRIAGLYLWEVEIRFHTGPGKGHCSLWITTPRESMQRALEKAQSFLRRSDYEGPEIVGIKAEGTLDA